MTRAKILYIVLALVVFSGATWGGFALHGRLSAGTDLAQPGWCCIAAERSCSVSQGSDACQSAGGVAFNWDKNSCNNICFQIQPKRAGDAAASVSGDVVLP